MGRGLAPCRRGGAGGAGLEGRGWRGGAPTCAPTKILTSVGMTPAAAILSWLPLWPRARLASAPHASMRSCGVALWPTSFTIGGIPPAFAIISRISTDTSATLRRTPTACSLVFWLPRIVRSTSEGTPPSLATVAASCLLRSTSCQSSARAASISSLREESRSERTTTLTRRASVCVRSEPSGAPRANAATPAVAARSAVRLRLLAGVPGLLLVRPGAQAWASLTTFKRSDIVSPPCFLPFLPPVASASSSGCSRCVSGSSSTQRLRSSGGGRMASMRPAWLRVP